MFKKGMALLTALIVCSGIISGCSKNEETVSTPKGDTEPKKITIKMSGWLEAEEATEKIFKEMISDFETENPNIKVETTAIPFNQYKDQMLIAASSENAPDVIMGNSQMMVAFNGAGILEPLDDLINKEIINDMFPNNLDGTTFNGKIMALSWAPHPLAMFYNKELFKKAKLDPENPPKTWDEMVDASKKIAALGKDENGNKIYGISHPIAKVSHSGAVTNGIIYAFGGQFIDKDGKVAFDNPGTHDAFKYIKDLVASGVMPAGVEAKDVRGLFASGALGITFDGDMGRSVFRNLSGKGQEFDKVFGVATIPVNKTGKSETVYTEHELAISKSSSNKKEAAKLIEFLLSKDAMIKYHKSNAVLSARKSIASLPDMNEDDYMKVFNKQSETARPLPATNPLFDNAMLEVTKALERITAGNEDIDKVIKETQAKIQEIYNQ